MWQISRRIATRNTKHFGCPSRLSSWACVETPNPNVRKFELSRAAMTRAPARVRLSDAQSQLLLIDGVRDVFIPIGDTGMNSAGSAQWLSITGASNTDWEVLRPLVQAVLDQCPEVGAENSGLDDSTHSPNGAEPSTGSGSVDTNRLEGEIVEILEHRVRPSVQADGGDVELVSWDPISGEVLLQLRGACRGCPQSAATLQHSILRTLQHFVPEVRSVRAKEELDDEVSTDPYADIPWEHIGEPDPDAIMSLAAAKTPFFSLFAGMKIEGRKLRQVRFLSRLNLAGRTPEHIFIKCPDCRLRRTVEDPQDLLRESKGNTTGNAAVVICPSCCVLITR